MKEKPNKKATEKRSVIGSDRSGSAQATKVSESMAALETTGSNTEMKNNPSRIEVIEELREGYSFEQFKGIVRDIPIEYGDWPNILHISKRTLDRYKDENRSFDLPSSERISHIEEKAHRFLIGSRGPNRHTRLTESPCCRHVRYSS